MLHYESDPEYGVKLLILRKSLDILLPVPFLAVEERAAAEDVLRCVPVWIDKGLMTLLLSA